MIHRFTDKCRRDPVFTVLMVIAAIWAACTVLGVAAAVTRVVNGEDPPEYYDNGNSAVDRGGR